MKSKIFILTIACLALFIVLFSCKKKNTITDNNPPNTPFAPQITIDTSEIGEKVTFTITVFDPDEDSVAARFNWGDGDTSGWSNFAPSGETISMYHYFHLKGTFYIRAQVKDIHEETSDWSEPDSIVIQDSAWTLVWTCATPNAPWSPRSSHTSVVFDNKIWVIGGGTNDVWSSTDGVNWICATASAPWSPRGGHTSVVFDNKIWVIGGTHIYRLNDVWYSPDGVNWTCANDSAEWQVRSGHTSVVFNNKMWVMGGFSGSEYFYNDVWFSSDGISWTCAAEAAPWEHREHPTSLVLDNRIWIMGGIHESCHWLEFCDVWKSTDGSSWECITDSAGWLARCSHTSLIFDNKVWLMAGMACDSVPPNGWHSSNDIWYVEDSILIQWNRINEAPWQCLTDSAPWHKREYHTSVVFNNKIWILGGNGGGNDVWYGEIVHGKR